jgi:ribosomal protein S18 acetylase RimI-like enzyme
LGPRGAAEETLALSRSDCFYYEPSWWRLATDQDGNKVGFFLPVAFAGKDRGGLREGTILYMGVLPSYRGNGYSRELLAQAVRTFQSIGVWRIFCDTDDNNAPMIAAFRAAGFRELPKWRRSF